MYTLYPSCQRPSSITTRIKTFVLWVNKFFVVRDHLPLQQGLRLLLILKFANTQWRQRPSSITTRIKTVVCNVGALCVVGSGQRLSSITTRIKTQFVWLALLDCTVRDHLPLQQGLRRGEISIQIGFWDVRDHLPLQQGLRHVLCTFQRLLESETIFHYNKD